MIRLIFGTHNHQPVGNLEEVMESAYQRCYLPFVETLYRHPNIKCALHYSGALLDWLKSRKKREFFEKIAEMLQREQAELLSGAYYEPILSIIPERDSKEQIHLLSNFIEQEFGYIPKGMWLAERIWQPNLSGIIKEAGLHYTMLDDSHFRYAGMKDKEILGYYATNENTRINIFPINKQLRYLAPFHPIEMTINYLKKLASKNNNKNTILLIDDGEKFGFRRRTYEYGWLERFFCRLEQNQDWLITSTLQEAIEETAPAGSLNIPPTSYDEMVEWMEGRHFNNFFRKYAESNNLHKKMLYVSEKVWGMRDKKINIEVFKELWKGQCNCAYWHGIFGGIYLPHLRHSLYSHLIKAEKAADLINGNEYPMVEISNFRKEDGKEDILIKTETFNIYIAPSQGGSIFELDIKERNYNLLNTMTRRKEKYHRGFKPQLIYDAYRRSALIEHILPSTTKLSDIAANSLNPLNTPCEYTVDKNGSCVHINMRKKAVVECGAIILYKKLSLDKEADFFDIHYCIEKEDEPPVSFRFAVEFNLAFSCQEKKNKLIYYQKAGISYAGLDEQLELKALERLEVEDFYNRFKVGLIPDKETNFWTFPLYTTSASENGYEKNYQQSVIIPFRDIKLKHGNQRWEMTMRFSVINTEKIK